MRIWGHGFRGFESITGGAAEQPTPPVEVGVWGSGFSWDGRPGGRASQPEIGEDMTFKDPPSVTNIPQSDANSEKSYSLPK